MMLSMIEFREEFGEDSSYVGPDHDHVVLAETGGCLGHLWGQFGQQFFQSVFK